MREPIVRWTTLFAALSAAASSAGCKDHLLGLSAAIEVSPAEIAFGHVALGVTHQLRVSVTNSGSVGLEVMAIKIASDPNAELAVTGFVSDCAGLPVSGLTSLAAGACAQFSVNWTPSMARMADGSIEIDSNDAANPVVTLPVTGDATAPALQVCVLSLDGGVDPAACSVLPETIPTVDFGTNAPGAAATRTLRVLNQGTSSLNFRAPPAISNTVGTPTSFSVSGSIAGNTLAAGQHIDLALTATSSTAVAAGTITGELDLSSNDALAPQLAVPLQTEIASAKLCLDPAAGLDFGAVQLGKTVTQPLTITNCGTTALTVSSLSFQALAPTTSQLAITSGSLPAIGATLAANAKITLGLTYAPTAAERDSAAIDYLFTSAAGPVQGSIPIAGKGATCDGQPGSPVSNACGICGGAPVSGVGQSCTAPNGCTTTGTCASNGLSLVCDAPAFCDLANHVVFSQITGYGPSTQTSQAGEYDEFIELYNPTGAAIDVSGYLLWYRDSDKTTGFWSKLGAVGSAGQKIAAHGYWLGVYGGSIGSTYTGTAVADFHYSTNTSNFDRAHGQAVLWLASAGTPTNDPQPSDPGFVDFVGYGAAPGTSTGQIAVWDGAAPAPAPAGTNTASIIRKAFPASTSSSMASGGADSRSGNGVGTDDNGSDWVAIDPRYPRNSATPAAP